jgi:proteasome accessory factor C
MDLFDRIYTLHQLMRNARYPVHCSVIEEHLQCSRATAQRTIREMREYLGAPLFYDKARKGYRYIHTGERPYELPGLWFNHSEIRALLAMQQLFAEVQPGLLDPLLAPLRKRIERILAFEQTGKRTPAKSKSKPPPDPSPQLALLPEPDPPPVPPSQAAPATPSTAQLLQRVRLAPVAARRADPAHFAIVADALGRRRRLRIRYHSRGRDRFSERDISPQRLTHYRDNWYLEAWCHQQDDLRRFSVDRILQARILDDPADEVPDEVLRQSLDESYGIFAGPARYTAELLFSAERARWVADERWHPDQHGERLADGRYRLRVPYADHRELVMDILRHGAQVEVLAPAELRRLVRDTLRHALDLYTEP